MNTARGRRVAAPRAPQTFSRTLAIKSFYSLFNEGHDEEVQWYEPNGHH